MSFCKSVDIIRELESGEEIKVCKKILHLHFPLYCETQEATLSAAEKNLSMNQRWRKCDLRTA